MRQKPKLGNDTIARLPIRIRVSMTRRGWRVACSVWLSTTTSKRARRIGVEVAVGVALDDRQPLGDAGVDA